MAQVTQLRKSIAPLRNVTALIALIESAANRHADLPCMGVFHGPSGYGKTMAATFAANQFRAYYVEVKSCWQPKWFCKSVLKEMDITPRGCIAEMVEKIAEEMICSNRPLLVDEADYMMTPMKIKLLRDIHDLAKTPLILIGEENMPAKLQQWERVHGRMLDWVGAKPACIADVDELAKIYCPGVILHPFFKQQLLNASEHSIRRVSTNLYKVEEQAKIKGIREFGPENWNANQFIPCAAPTPRRELA